MSGNPDQEHFSDGITEDIITDLSKVSALRIISRNSAFQYKGEKQQSGSEPLRSPVRGSDPVMRK